MTLKILVFFIFISQTICGQTSLQEPSKPFLFIDSIFSKDNYTVEILDFEFSKDIQEIVLRVQKAMTENKEWAEDYFSKNYKPGEGLPYHENFGVTKDEYLKIKDIAKSSPTVVVKSTALVKVNRILGILSFEAIESGTQFFESVEINFKNEALIFLNDTIPFSHEVNASESGSFGKWHGYSWEKEVSNLGENDDLKVDSLVSKIVEISIGKIQMTGKIFFRLKYKEVDKGVVKANFDVSCYLN